MIRCVSALVVVAVAAVAVFVLAALAQAASGFGSALVAVPLLGFVVGPGEALVAATVAGLVLTGGAWRREHGHTDAPVVRRLTVAGVLGMPAGLAVLLLASERVLTSVIAVVLLGTVALLAAGVRLPTGRRAQWGAGVASGTLLTSTGMNGPPLVLVLRDEAPHRFRATLQATFCLQDAVAVVAFVALGQVGAPVLVAAAAGVLGMPLGWRLGDAVFRRLSPERFRVLVLAGLAATGTVALVGALA